MVNRRDIRNINENFDYIAGKLVKLERLERFKRFASYYIAIITILQTACIVYGLWALLKIKFLLGGL